MKSKEQNKEPTSLKKNKADKRKKEAQEFERTEKAKNTRPKRRS